MYKRGQTGGILVARASAMKRTTTGGLTGRMYCICSQVHQRNVKKTTLNLFSVLLNRPIDYCTLLKSENSSTLQRDVLVMRDSACAKYHYLSFLIAYKRTNGLS